MDRHTINLEFFASYELFEQIPSLNCQEIAFVGASNSGKSSAINLLANNKKLSYTSKKPGKTKLFNYFKKDNNFIVDFPGIRICKYFKISNQIMAEGITQIF